MHRFSLSVLAFVAALGLTDIRAEEAPAAAEPVQEKANSAKVKNETLKKHIMGNIDIFGKTDLPAIYILMPGVDGEEDIKGSLLTRDFSRDPFFMQNVDREEFELKVTLRDFSEADEDKKEKEEAAAKR